MTAPKLPRRDARKDPRRRQFAETLARNDGNLTLAAAELGVSHRTAREWWRELRAGTLLRGMDPEDDA